MQKNKKILIGVGALIVVIGLMLGIYFLLMPGGTAGEKNLTVQVVYADSSTKDFPIQTNAEMLGEALTESGLAEGDIGDFGLFITTVDGVTVDSSKNEFWSISKDGEILMTGADSTPIADGEHYELTLSTY